MASPMPMQPVGGWSDNGQAMPQPNGNDDSGVQVRSVGLKVHYKFNKEDRFDCLARPSQTFSVQTIPIDDTTTIGVIDLRICIQAVIDCSPELPGQQCDYTIYAHDYSEPDTPLVGQGMLSSALHSLHLDMGPQVKMVTGLVAKNKLGLLMGSANKETLEVKLKFSETPRSQPPQQQQPYPQPMAQSQPQPQPQQQSQPTYHQPIPQQPPQAQPDAYHTRPRDGAMTPNSTAEWNSFMQSSVQFNQHSTFSRVASPALSTGQAPSKRERRDSTAQGQFQILQPMPQQEVQRVAPIPIEPASEPNGMGATSRPSSRASNKAPARKRATGRPRGRPRKKPAEGHTSGYEDGTEGEDAPAKKRAKTTQVDKSSANPFGTEPESLRVAASTSGSLRSFRPIAMSQEGANANHLQEVPRAPTPISMPPMLKRGPKSRKGQPALNRGASNVSTASNIRTSPQHQRMRALSPSQEDGRSPESVGPESVGQTPAAYSEDSPPDIGSSPPVPRATSFMSSPAPSSPILPPMPEQQMSQDGMENEDVGDLFGEEPAQPAAAEKPAKIAPAKAKSTSRRGSTVPMQVFRMEEKPDGGQDMVHVCSYNTPDPTSAPAAPASDLPNKPAPRALRPLVPANAFAAPTPPQTTDTIEKPTSPPLPETQSQDVQPSIEQASVTQVTAQTPSVQSPFLAGVPGGPQDDSAIAEQQHLNENKESNGNKMIDSQAPAQQQTQEQQMQEKPADNTVSKQKPAKPQPRSRKLARSHSAGPLALPVVPASEPAGPSGLSQAMTAEPPQPPTADAPASLRRAKSTGPLSLPMLASDPVGPSGASQPPLLALPEPICPPSDAVLPAPSSPQGERSNKNVVKKNAIRQKLEAAIKRGEMPPYCSNCGAIETPTWRRIYSQDRDGAPPQVEFSSKPGMITALEVLKFEGETNEPVAHRIVKKNLGPEEPREEWQEMLLCNPCGIWLGKWFSHRPKDRWEGDAARIGKERKKRGSEPPAKPRAKKPRTKSTGHVNPTSEAYLPTDAPEPSSPKGSTEDAPMVDRAVSQGAQTEGNVVVEGQEGGAPRSTHSSTSRADAKSPVEVEMDAAMGTTKRLLFPSPRKDNSPKALCEVNVNVVQTDIECSQRKEVTIEKENLAVPATATAEKDDLEDLFRSPMPPRPSTPPSRAKAGPPSTPFKTPTRATPSHRPITRSVSRSLRSKDSLNSPMVDVQKTPSRTPGKTPRDFGFLGSGSKRRSPRHHHGIDFDDCIFDTPVSRAVNQMLSEPNFGLDDEMELVSLGGVDTDPNWAQFSTFFSTDAPMPSSPPKDRMTFGADPSADMWDWSMYPDMEANKEEK